MKRLAWFIAIYVASVIVMVVTTYLQAHHLDLEFYGAFYQPGAYLRTHGDHMARWHGAEVHGAP